MPRIHRPRTLYRICILSIVQSMDAAWDTVWRPTFQHGDWWPPDILAELIEELKLSKLLTQEHLPVLIRSNLRRLNLSECQIPIELSFISERTQNLQDLDLSFCTSISTKNLCHLAQHSPNLKIVRLRCTQSNDEVLHKLGENCPSLEKLDIGGCKQVTDAGFLTDKPNNWFMQLNYLNARQTKMTRTGASYALKTFKHLQDFYFPNVKDVILDLTNADDVSLKEYKLRSFDAFKFMDVFTVLCIIPHCRFLSDLYLFSAKMTDSDLFTLSQLKHLQSLSLEDSDHLLTYTDGVMPILEQLGKRLTRLTLSQFNNVDCVSLSRLCTSLQDLQLYYNQSYVNISDEEARLCGFGKLEVLDVVCDASSSISESHILFIVGQSHSLRNLFMVGCPVLTDDVFMKILLLNPLKCLQKLRLVECNFLTPVTAHLLLNMHNDLRKVKFYGCETIQENDCDRMKKIVLENNMDVQINWRAEL